MPETYEFAERLAAGPPTVTRPIKRALYQSARSDLRRTSLDLNSLHMGIGQSMPESHEAFDAFREKRAPASTPTNDRPYRSTRTSRCRESQSL